MQTSDKNFPELKTSRLKLRALKQSDKNEVFEIRSDKNIAKYLDRPLYKTIQEAEEFIEKISSANSSDWYYWTITLSDSDELIGTICLWNFPDDKKIADTGYEMRTKFQGNGYAKEALQKIIEFGFENLALEKITAEVAPENKASIKMLEKFNFCLNTSVPQNSKTIIYELSRNINQKDL
ncbi:MAG: GNAT family N-acetyltransferase [Rhodothermaceae bacterium]